MSFPIPAASLPSEQEVINLDQCSGFDQAVFLRDVVLAGVEGTGRAEQQRKHQPQTLRWRHDT